MADTSVMSGSAPELAGGAPTTNTETIQHSDTPTNPAQSSNIEMRPLSDASHSEFVMAPTTQQDHEPSNQQTAPASALNTFGQPSSNATVDNQIYSATAPQETTTENITKPTLTRELTAPAIGPATDKPTPLSKEMTSDGPILYITLLLASTGARHPFKLDSRYLKKRGVEAEDDNPINISLYKLKELILRDWREEWSAKPSSPESIRLITMGKLLNDKVKLADSGFKNGTTPHIVHMTVKPQDIVDEEEANKATGKDRETNERSPGCRCVIQ